MPSDAKFNGASNDAVAGRARGAGQRNLLSYLRGAVDVVDDPRTGRPVEPLLRGRSGDTWGAVAMTFVNDQERRFTALRTYYVPRRATRSGEVQMQLATLDAPVDLAGPRGRRPRPLPRQHAEEALPRRPGAPDVRRVRRGPARPARHRGQRRRREGAAPAGPDPGGQPGAQRRRALQGDGAERPATFAAADRAVEHFDDLESAYRAMRTEEQKQELLAPITGPARAPGRRRRPGGGAGRVRGDRGGGQAGAALAAPHPRARCSGRRSRPTGGAGREVAEELRTSARDGGLARRGPGGGQGGAPVRGRRHPGAARRRHRAGAGAPRGAVRPPRAPSARGWRRWTRTARRRPCPPGSRSPRWWPGPRGGWRSTRSAPTSWSPAATR